MERKFELCDDSYECGSSDYEYINGALLHLAIKSEDVERIKLLLNAGVTIFAANESGVTALEAAVASRKSEIVSLLLSLCDLSEIDLRKESDIYAIFVACRTSNNKFIGRWTQYGLSVNVHDWCQDTPLHVIASSTRSDSYSTMECLLEHAANPNAVNDVGYTPLHVMVSNYGTKEIDQQGNVIAGMIRKFVDSGADINYQDPYGRTALHMSKLNSQFNCISELLQCGADACIEDYSGLTVLDYIFEILHSENCLNDLSARREPTTLEKEVYEPARIILHHVLIMNELGLNVSESVKSRIVGLKNWFDYMYQTNVTFSDKYLELGLSTASTDEFIQDCKMEKKKLRKLKLDGSISLYDLFHKDDFQMSIIVKKSGFQEYFTSGKYKVDFPISSHFLERQYKVGCVREELQSLAMESLGFLNLPLPDLCVYEISKNFNISELKEFIYQIFRMRYPASLFN